MIEAVQITDENMDALCELIGYEVRPKGNTRFIAVDKRIVPNGYRAYVGWWVTKMGDNLRCYPNRVFNDQFIPYGPEWESWFEDENPDGVSTQHEDETEDARQVLVTFEDESTSSVRADDAALDEHRDQELANVPEVDPQKGLDEYRAAEEAREDRIATQDALDHVVSDDEEVPRPEDLEVVEDHEDDPYGPEGSETKKELEL